MSFSVSWYVVSVKVFMVTSSVRVEFVWLQPPGSYRRPEDVLVAHDAGLLHVACVQTQEKNFCRWAHTAAGRPWPCQPRHTLALTVPSTPRGGRHSCG